MHTAVAEEEVAAAWVQTAEATNPVLAETVVAKRVVAVDRRRTEAAIHWFIARVGRQAVLGRHRKHRAIPRMIRIAGARSAPQLLKQRRLTRDAVDRCLARILQIAN